MRTINEMRGTRVIGGKKGKSKIGKITTTIFHPAAPRVVGYTVKRPDFLWMIQRKDKFLALDAYEVVDGRIKATKGAESWDDKACERLKIDLDKCVIWENMPVKTKAGYEMGYVYNVKFDERNGKVISLEAGDGISAKALLGTYTIPVEYIVGYSSAGYLLVEAEARDADATGGLAAKAGTATAKAGQGVSKAAKKTGEAINDGAYAIGSAIGKRRAKKAAEEAAEEAAERAAEEAAAKARAEAAAARARAAALNAQAAAAKAGNAAPAAGAASATGAAPAAAKPAAAAPAAAAPKPAAAAAPKKGGAAQALGRQLGKSKGMFAAFKEEYQKGKSGD